MAISHQGSTGVLTTATAQGSTSISVAYPSGVAAGRMAILFAAVKLSTATFSDPAGWTLIGSQTGGTGASANDAGTTRIGVWYRILDGSETGSVTVTNTGGVSSAGAMSIYSGTLGGWETPPVFVGGADTTHGTNPTASCGAWSSALAANDWVVWGFSNDTDVNKALTGPGLSQSGGTFGTTTHRNQTLSTTGTDSGINTFDTPVTTGTTNATSAVFTSAVSQCGAFMLVRLREQTAASTVALAPAVITVTTQPVTPVPGPVTVALAPAVLSLTAVPLDPVITPATVDLAPATLALGARPVTPVPGMVSVGMAPAALTLTGRPLTLLSGPLSVSLAPAPMQVAAGPLAPVPGSITVALTPAVVALAAVPLSLPAASGEVTLAPATLTLGGQPFTPVPGPVVVALIPAGLALSAVPVNAAPGPVAIALASATLALVAVGLDPVGVEPIVIRPFDGLIARPGTGITARPSTGNTPSPAAAGTTARPDSGVTPRP